MSARSSAQSTGHSAQHVRRDHGSVHIGSRRYVSEYTVKALGSDRGIDFRELMKALASDVRIVRGVRYVDEIALHRRLRATEQGSAHEQSATDSTTEETSKHSPLRSIALFITAAVFGGAAMVGMFYLTALVADPRMENSFSHSARTMEEPTYSTLSANPSFVFADLFELMRKHIGAGRQ